MMEQHITRVSEAREEAVRKSEAALDAERTSWQPYRRAAHFVIVLAQISSLRQVAFSLSLPSDHVYAPVSYAVPPLRSVYLPSIQNTRKRIEQYEDEFPPGLDARSVGNLQGWLSFRLRGDE
jgi:hypothetical protein